MGENILEVLKKEIGEQYQDKIKTTAHKYMHWATGDYNLYFNTGVNFNNLTAFFKKYNYDVKAEGSDEHIYVMSTISDDGISTDKSLTNEEYINSLHDFAAMCEEVSEEETWKTDLERLRKFNIQHTIKARTEIEAKYIALLALYISKANGEILLYDTSNDIYLDSEKLQELFK